jgi:hypothetical protein
MMVVHVLYNRLTPRSVGGLLESAMKIAPGNLVSAIPVHHHQNPKKCGVLLLCSPG